MIELDKYLIFLCSGASKVRDRKLSYRIASKLVAMGHGDIGSLQDLSEQHQAPFEQQKRMIFINDCRSGCVNVFTHGFDKSKYIFLDVSPHIGNDQFDVDQFINAHVLPMVTEKWPDSLQISAL